MRGFTPLQGIHGLDPDFRCAFKRDCSDAVKPEIPIIANVMRYAVDQREAVTKLAKAGAFQDSRGPSRSNVVQSTGHLFHLHTASWLHLVKHTLAFLPFHLILHWIVGLGYGVGAKWP